MGIIYLTNPDKHLELNLCGKPVAQADIEITPELVFACERELDSLAWCQDTGYVARRVCIAMVKSRVLPKRG